MKKLRKPSAIPDDLIAQLDGASIDIAEFGQIQIRFAPDVWEEMKRHDGIVCELARNARKGKEFAKLWRMKKYENQIRKAT